MNNRIATIGLAATLALGACDENETVYVNGIDYSMDIPVTNPSFASTYVIHGVNAAIESTRELIAHTCITSNLTPEENMHLEWLRKERKREIAELKEERGEHLECSKNREHAEYEELESSQFWDETDEEYRAPVIQEIESKYGKEKSRIEDRYYEVKEKIEGDYYKKPVVKKAHCFRKTQDT